MSIYDDADDLKDTSKQLSQQLEEAVATLDYCDKSDSKTDLLAQIESAKKIIENVVSELY